MRKKYEVKNVPSVPSSVNQVEQEKPVRMKDVVRQPTATELLHQSYNEIKRLRTTRKTRKDTSVQIQYVLIVVNINYYLN